MTTENIKHPPIATAIRRSGMTATGLILRVLGFILVVPGVLIALAGISMMSLSEKDAASSGAVALCIAAGMAGIGFALLSLGRNANSYWICSNCGNKLSTKEARLCAACRLEIR